MNDQKEQKQNPSNDQKDPKQNPSNDQKEQKQNPCEVIINNIQSIIKKIQSLFNHFPSLQGDDIKTEKSLKRLIKDGFKERKEIQQEIKMVYRRYVWHLLCFRGAKRGYAKWDKRFLIFIPVYSTVLTFLLSTNIIDSFLNNSEVENNILAVLSLILSIVTVVNSTIKPHEKSVELSNLLIKLNTWMLDFMEGLIEKKDNKEGDREMNLFLKNMDDRITQLGERSLIILNNEEIKNNKPNKA